MTKSSLQNWHLQQLNTNCNNHSTIMLCLSWKMDLVSGSDLWHLTTSPFGIISHEVGTKSDIAPYITWVIWVCMDTLESLDSRLVRMLAGVFEKSLGSPEFIWQWWNLRPEQSPAKPSADIFHHYPWNATSRQRVIPIYFQLQVNYKWTMGGVKHLNSHFVDFCFFMVDIISLGQSCGYWMTSN